MSCYYDVSKMMILLYYYVLKLYLYIFNGTRNLDEKEDTALCMWVCVFMYGVIYNLTPI